LSGVVRPGERLMPTLTDENIEVALRQIAAVVDAALRERLAAYDGASPRLAEAMRYSLEGGGKRIRPALVLWCCEACGEDARAAVPAAMAVECVHTFSLIHDDLPALDDDDLRRGRPTCHKQYGEAMAILAGDALLALAFEVLGREMTDSAVAAAMVRELAAAAGWQGMIGGEAADIEGEAVPPDADLVARIHAAKTARLIEVCCRLGALAAKAPKLQEEALAGYGRHLGLAFQATDDLLDMTASADQMGKRTRKDASAGKQTYPRVVGMDGTRRIAQEAVNQAVAALEVFGAAGARLIAVAQFVLERGR
jgi:geranylgeranyl diphosphate synthase, type II